MKKRKFLYVLTTVGLLLVGGMMTSCGGTDVPTPVEEDKATSVTISGSGNNVTVGSTLNLSAAVSPSSAGQSVTWSSSDTKVATVAAGVVTGVAAGNATITAESTVTAGIKGTYNIVVVAAEYKPDLSQNVTLSMSVNYDKSTGMTYNQDTEYTTPKGTVIKNGDFKPVYKELQKNLNFTINDVTDSSDKAVNYFKANWQTNQYADIAGANVSDINDFSVSGESETILDISEYMDYLPNFSEFLNDYPIVRQSIETQKYGDPNSSGVYYFPYFDGFDDLEKMTLLRADFVRKILDGDYVASDWDTKSDIWTSSEYKATVSDDSYTVKVAESLDSTKTKTITKAKTTNIITQQNALTGSERNSATMVKQFRDYVKAKYGTQYANPSDLFLGVDASYDADEMVALMRIVRVSPKALTGNADCEMVPLLPREYNNQRVEDLYRWGAQLWGVRGIESRSGYLYIGSDGKIHDARGDKATANMINNLNALYDEGLVAQDFESKSNYGVTNGKYAEGIVVGGNAKYCGFMEYDYAQTQGVWNDKAGSLAIEGYDFRPIITGVYKWDGTNYFQFTESWRSVKTQAWCLNASLKKDEKKLMRALALCDYMYSDEGHQLNSYGPESEGYTNGTINYQGRTVAKFTDKALAQLNDSAIGGGSYTNYLRKFVGATLPVGYIKEQGMEYQCTSKNAMNGLTIINKAIEVGTYKHVECKMTDDPFYTISPSSFFLSKGQVESKTTLEGAATLGSINSKNSTSAYNIWANYFMYGFGGKKGDVTLETIEQYLKMVNETWKLPQLVKIYQDAYDYMTA